MNNDNTKLIKAREFCEKVKELAKEYDLSFFVVTEGASAISNNGCEAVKNARDNHIKWELEHNADPYEDWSKKKEKIQMNDKIKQLSGANMDIDLTTDQESINWEQETCPWNKEEKSNEHKCAIKNTSICKYFCGIKHLDSVLCSYPYENTDVLKEEKEEDNQD